MPAFKLVYLCSYSPRLFKGLIWTYMQSSPILFTVVCWSHLGQCEAYSHTMPTSCSSPTPELVPKPFPPTADFSKLSGTAYFSFLQSQNKPCVSNLQRKYYGWENAILRLTNCSWSHKIFSKYILENKGTVNCWVVLRRKRKLMSLMLAEENVFACQMVFITSKAELFHLQKVLF